MNDVEKTLAERGSNYGDYARGVQARAAVMYALKLVYKDHHNEEMPDTAQGMIWDIVNKLCRIAVTPDHLDSWHDIQGYARLAEIALGGDKDD